MVTRPLVTTTSSHTPRKLIEQAQSILRALPDSSMLPPRHLELLKRRASGATFQEMADEMDLSRERICDLYPQALKRARRAMCDTPAAFHVFERFG